MNIDIDLLKEQLQTFQKENAVWLPSKVLETDLANLQFFASEPWRSGGVTGGSCWGGEAIYPINSDSENDITSLDKFLEDFYPETSFLTYRKILDKISYGEYSDYEYYGNYTNYSFKYITLDDIVSAFEHANENENDYDSKPKHRYR